MDDEDIKDGLAFYFSNCNDSEKNVFSFIDIKKFLEINNVLDLEDDNLLHLLSEMISEGIIEEKKSENGELSYHYDNFLIDRIRDRNEELSMKWIIPKVENYDYEENNSDNTSDDEFLLEADDQENKEVNKELIYDSE